MPLHNLTRFPRLEFIGAPTPLEYLPRFSDYLGRDIFIKRDDVTPMAMGGNKLRKLEFLAADALREGADTLITAGAIQSNHVRQTAAVAAKLGLHCVALRKGNEDLLKAVDEAIAEMQKDGSLKALSEKWFGADVTK